jgi:hypothetical protein
MVTEFSTAMAELRVRTSTGVLVRWRWEGSINGSGRSL